MTFPQLLRICVARRWIVLLSWLVICATTTAVTLMLPKSYSATATIMADFRTSDPVMGLGVAAQLIPGFMATQAEIIRSDNVASKVVGSLGLDDSPAVKRQYLEETRGRGSLVHWLADRLLKGLTVRPSRESTVIAISYMGNDGKAAARVANAFAEEYIKTNLELRIDPARQSATWFQERARALRGELEAARSRLSDYEGAKGLTASEERVDAESARLDQLNAQLSQQQGLTYDALTRNRLAQDFMDRGAPFDSIPEVLQSGLVQSIKTELARAEARLKEHASQFGTRHPQYLANAAEVESLRQKLRDEMRSVMTGIDNNYRITQEREQELRAAVKAQKQRVLGLKKQRDELGVLGRESDNAQKSFDIARERQSQTELQSKSTQTNIVLLSPAVEPYKPSYPIVWLNVLLSCIAGLLVGVGAAVALEASDGRVRSSADIQTGIDYGAVVALPRATFTRRGRSPGRVLQQAGPELG